MRARPEPDLTSAEGLADALGLHRREVAAVQVESTATAARNSITFLRVVYAGAAAASLPKRLVLKRLPPTPPGAKPEPAYEADFFARVAPALPSPPVVRCLTVRTPSPTSAAYVLIEDLYDTHAAPVPDADIDFGPVVDALARIHASLWEAGDRSTWPRSNHTEKSLRTAIQKMAAYLPEFFDTVGDALPPDGRRLYERVFASAMRPWLRLLDGRAMTLIHGDAHIGNVLLPREPGGAVYFIDWERWQADLGARDLAYMMLRRSPDRRRQLEEPLLRRYHARLEALGVHDYGWDDLWTDYRRCCVRNLAVPVVLLRKQRFAMRWRELLDHAIAAFVDLEGEELL